MNILFLYRNYIDPVQGGIQRVTKVLGDYFSTKGHNVFYISLLKNPNQNNSLENQFYLPNEKDITSQQNMKFLGGFTSKKNVDIIINQNGMDPIFSSLVFSINTSKTKIVSCIHNSLLGHINYYSTAYSVPNKPLYNFFLKITDNIYVKKVLLKAYKKKYKKHYQVLLDKSDKVVLLSKSFIGELKFFVSEIDDSKVIGIGNPVSFKKNGEDYTSKKNELLYVGRINSSQKKVDLLIKIWERIHYSHKDWVLNIVGGGDELVKFKELIKKKGLERIHFLGFKDPEPFYKTAKIFCMTSSYEGFGIVLIEAMQNGVVPIAFNSYASVTDIIDDKENGFLINPFNVKEYSSQIEYLIVNSEKVENLSKKARRKAIEFSLENVGNNWLNLFESLNN